MSTYVPPPSRSVRPANLPASVARAVRGPAAAAPAPRRGELPALIAVALVLAFLIKTLLVQAFFIPSGSMIPTLEIGDRVLVEKVTYRFREPERGEVIVFRRPGAVDERSGVADALRSFLEGLGLVQPNSDIDLIKRIIALPGETVELRGGVVSVDGEPLAEPYARVDQDDFGPLEVPEDSYFMLGDNRGNSADSRTDLGTVPRENVVGKAFIVLWPPTHFDPSLGAEYDGAD